MVVIVREDVFIIIIIVISLFIPFSLYFSLR